MNPSLVNNHRVLVIGFDGASFDLAKPWIDSGKLPALKQLLQNGGGGYLRSVLPVMSPAAWSSFSTGVNPGKHGVFDFSQRAKDEYKLRVITAQDVKAPTLWRLLSDAGKRVAVVNVPITYPAESINGVMVTGLGTPEMRSFTYPTELSQRLRSEGYRVNKIFFYRPGAEAAFLRDVYDITSHVAKVALNLLEQEAWDFFMVVFRDSDEMGHFFWKHMDPHHPAHNPKVDTPYKNALFEYYQYLDKLAGELIEAAGENVNVVIMSDHGMGPLYKEVFLNEWLNQKNWQVRKFGTTHGRHRLFERIGLTRSAISQFLQSVGLAPFERWLRTMLGDKKKILPAHARPIYPDVIDWQKTLAYSYGYQGQIFLNVEGREPMGIVKPENYMEIRSQIEIALWSLVDPEDGLPIVSDIVTQENAFHGPYASTGPDLVVTMRNLAYMTRLGYEFGSQAEIFLAPSTATYESGSHRLNGMVFLCGPDFVHKDNPLDCSILDLAPTILHLLGLPIASHMDGDVLVNELKPEIRHVHKSTYDQYKNIKLETETPQITEKEEEEITERLKNLGYLG